MRRTVLPAFLLLLCVEHASGDLCTSLHDKQLSEQLQFLTETIQHHDTLYYRNHHPELSDAEYDALVDRRNTLAQRLGKPAGYARDHVDITGPVSHIAPLSSLKKGKNAPEVLRFIESLQRLGSPVLLQPKIDGVAAELVYRDGRLIRASTRGDGQWGEDILPAIRRSHHIPKLLDTTIERIVLHGELFARLDLATDQLAPYASARHFTAATLQTDAPEKSHLAILDFFPWRWVDHDFQRDSLSHKQLANWGFFPIIDYSRHLTDSSKAEIWRQQLFDFQNTAPFLMDGVVIKADDMTIREQLGQNATAPHWALAWKFPANLTVTTVNDISFTIGRTGKVTVLLALEPTILSGLTIRQVPVGSVNRFQALNIALGDLISVALKGGAIPKLNNVIERPNNRTTITIPDLSYYNAFSCLRYSKQCHEQFLSRMQWLIGKEGLNIKALEKNILLELVHNDHIKEPGDLLLVTVRMLENTRLVNQSEAQRIYKNIDESRQRTLQHQMQSLSLPGIGKQRARELSIYFKEWRNLMDSSPDAIAKETTLGKKQAKALHRYMKAKEIQNIIHLLGKPATLAP